MTLANDQWQEAIVQLANSGISIGATPDTFGTATNITAATTFSGIPTVSQLAANSSVLLANPGDQATFIAEIAVASAFVGTLSFYGLEPDGATLQLIGTHQRGATTIANNTAINTGVALNQVWMGSSANFKTIYVVCTAFTSGSVSVQLGFTAAPYALAILNALNLVPFQDTQVTGTVTNANDVVSIALPGGQATAIVQILMGTLVGTLNFEVSPDSGTTYYAISGKAVNSSTFASTATAAGTWEFNVSGFTNFRVRLNPVTSGTSGTITIRLSQGVSNLAINNASTLGQQVMGSSSSVAIASDQSSIPMKAGLLETLSLTAGSLNADLLPATDISAYSLVSLQVTGTWVGTLQVQQSNDQVTWTAQIGVFPLTRNTNSVLNANNIIAFNRTSRYIRVRMTAYTSGTATGLVEFFTTGQEITPSSVTANPGNTANTTPWFVNAVGTTGGLNDYHLVSAATNNVTNVKASAGQFYGYEITNTNAAIRYVKLYNKASAPAPATDPVFRTIQVPASGKTSLHIANGLAMGTGISFAAVTGASDTDNTSVGAGDLIIDLEWK